MNQNLNQNSSKLRILQFFCTRVGGERTNTTTKVFHSLKNMNSLTSFLPSLLPSHHHYRFQMFNRVCRLTHPQVDIEKILDCNPNTPDGLPSSSTSYSSSSRAHLHGEAPSLPATLDKCEASKGAEKRSPELLSPSPWPLNPNPNLLCDFCRN